MCARQFVQTAGVFLFRNKTRLVRDSLSLVQKIQKQQFSSSCEAAWNQQLWQLTKRIQRQNKNTINQTDLPKMYLAHHKPVDSHQTAHNHVSSLCCVVLCCVLQAGAGGAVPAGESGAAGGSGPGVRPQRGVAQTRVEATPGPVRSLFLSHHLSLPEVLPFTRASISGFLLTTRFHRLKTQNTLWRSLKFVPCETSFFLVEVRGCC